MHITSYSDFSDDDDSDSNEINQSSSLKRPLETGTVSEQTGSDPSDPGIADSKSDADLDQPTARKKPKHDSEKLIRLLQRLFPLQKKEVGIQLILYHHALSAKVYHTLQWRCKK